MRRNQITATQPKKETDTGTTKAGCYTPPEYTTVQLTQKDVICTSVTYSDGASQGDVWEWDVFQ